MGPLAGRLEVPGIQHLMASKARSCSVTPLCLYATRVFEWNHEGTDTRCAITFIPILRRYDGTRATILSMWWNPSAAGTAVFRNIRD